MANSKYIDQLACFVIWIEARFAGGAAVTYQVRLTQFEGPLDLLLHLIRRDKINIYDIPISHITREYLAYIEVMRELELEIAGEFFVMAATLMRIKSQMLLPRHEEIEEEEDPRDELVRNLIEYRKFKEAASCLAEREEDRRKVFPRSVSPPLEAGPAEEVPEVTLFDLLEALQKVFAQIKVETTYRIIPEPITVEEKLALIRTRVAERSEVLFTELFESDYSKISIIVTFLATLEMIRMGELIARQTSHGSDIWLYKPGTSSYIQADGSEYGA
jgi:segregation and condensation protein A